MLASFALRLAQGLEPLDNARDPEPVEGLVETAKATEAQTGPNKIVLVLLIILILSDAPIDNDNEYDYEYDE